jgi:hypothetical protein
MVTEQFRVAVPDMASGERLRAALSELDAELRGSTRDLEVVATLKSPEQDIVLDAVMDTVERWLEEEDLGATRVQVGADLPSLVRISA